MSTVQAFVLAVGLAALATLADYFLKLASMETHALQNKWFLAGCLIYALGAFGWVFVLRHLKLATVGVVYSLATVMLLTALGVLAFGETLNRHEVAGIGFGVLSILLLARFGG